MIVENDLGVQEVMKIILEKAGYQVYMSNNYKIMSDVGWVQPDLYLLDIVSDYFEGIRVCQQLKASKATQPIPVLLISTSMDREFLTMIAGFDASLEKPFSVDTLRNLVDHWTNSKSLLAGTGC